MPFKSKAQRRFMYARHPRIARRWEKHTPKGTELPEKVKKKTESRVKTTGQLAFEQVLAGAPVKKVLVMMPTVLDVLQNEDTKVECWSVYDPDAESQQSYTLYVYKADGRGLWNAVGQLENIESEDVAKQRAAELLNTQEVAAEGVISGGKQEVMTAPPPTVIKRNHESVNYRKSEETEYSCGSCLHFEDGSCKLVEGKIDASFICNLFKPSKEWEAGKVNASESVNWNQFQREALTRGALHVKFYRNAVSLDLSSRDASYYSPVRASLVQLLQEYGMRNIQNTSFAVQGDI